MSYAPRSADGERNETRAARFALLRGNTERSRDPAWKTKLRHGKLREKKNTEKTKSWAAARVNKFVEFQQNCLGPNFKIGRF
jgi:hypothetical protein